MKVLSYNVWFDEYKQTERLESLLAVILSYDPDIICLQEVIPVVHTELKNYLKCYDIFPKKLKKSYGCVILSKHKIKNNEEYIFLNSVMGRSLLVTELMVNNKPLFVANCHFESMFKIKTKNKEKIKQYELSEEILTKISLKGPIILCADTNLLKSEEKYYFDNEKWTDCWNLSKDTKKQFTYDYYTNMNMKHKKMGKFRSRIDRIIYNGSLKLNQFYLIKGIDGLIHPSDHHGIMVDFHYL